MKHVKSLAALLVLCAWAAPASTAEFKKDYPIQAAPFTKVKIADAFWSPRMETNRRVTIPYAFKMCEETGRIDNFYFAGKLKPGKFRGIFFNDSDVYKVIEGAAYSLAIHPDPELDKYLDGVIAAIAAAQEPDGYLYTARTLSGPDYMPPGGKERWSDIGSGHELYNLGHLYEAAVAHHLATGKRTLLDVAIKSANLVCSVFGPGRKQNPPGHQEIEIGLAKLYRLTGDEKYLAMAKFFLDARGRANGRGLYGEYSQDHKPVVKQKEAVGHSVRAGYMYTGMADVAALTGDAAYVKAITSIWEDVVGRKLYITGGIGARGGGEAFGDPYELPNRSAYAETCAAIANALWNQRMFLFTGDSKYVDVLERVLYNGFLSGVSMEGNRFFYPNPLESHRGGERAPWFDCACCPSNVVRFVPSIPGYVYAHRNTDLYVNLFIGGSGTVDLPGNPVVVRQETRYPWDGAVKIAVEPQQEAAFAVLVRIPGWALNRPVPSDLYRYEESTAARLALKVNGEPVSIVLDKGFARLQRTWKKGDVVDLELPMPVRRVIAHDSVQADAGRVALERGPIVFCAEGVDNVENRVLNAVLDDSPLSATFNKDLLNGVVTLTGKAQVVRRRADGVPAVEGSQDLVAIPYYAWAHRKPSPMAVWLPREPEAAKPLPAATIAHRSKITVSGGGSIDALTDQLEPRNSIDHDNPYFHWWPKKGTQEWVQYDFAEPVKLAAADLYWFDDTGIGECRLPESWKLLAKVGGQWKPVENPSAYGVAKDRYNRVTFTPVLAEALRLEVQLPKDFAAGIHEFRVFADGDKLPDPDAPPQVARPELPNLMPNASFEEADAKAPKQWRTSTWSGKGNFEYATTGRTGKRSLMLTSTEGGDIAWTATVPVEPYTRYRLSGWVKTEDVKGTGRGALFNIHNIQSVATPAVTGTSNWKQVKVEFETDDEESLTINCLFGGWGVATGKAWFDDVRLEVIGRTRIPAATIRIDAGKTREPMSPYIYGQFIEHLGRCIYGGIWAEMLEDRKFFFAPGDKESPWKPIGGESAVTMIKENPFVGQHTPQINPAADGSPRGFAQAGLAFIKDKEYVGRIWTAGAGDATSARVAFIWGDGPQDRHEIVIDKLPAEFQKTPFRFTAKSGTDKGRIEITATGKGAVRIGTVSLMPADNVRGMRPDTLALLKELDSPVYRWPGGNFVSGYDWKDGIGDPDRRPPRKNPAWTGVEHNDFGMHEFIDFCRELKTEPYIAINSGLGNVQSAVEELQYANGAADTPMGRQRAVNGSPEPFKVVFWGVGNEMYGGWQLGHMPLEKYIEKHNEFAVALRKMDPSIKLVGVGAVGPWSEGMMRQCAQNMEYISEHFYCQDRPGLSAHVRQIPDNIKRIADAHRRYRQTFDSLKGRDIRIALDEWNYWYGPHVFGELGTRYFLKDGLGIAAGLHEYARNSDIIYMANYAQTVNVIGAIKTNKTAAAFETTGLVLKLYRQHFGTIPVATEVSGILDAQAALSADRKTLTIGIVNATLQPRQIPLSVKGVKLAGAGTRWQIAGSDPAAYNDPADPEKLRIEQAAISGAVDSLSVAPCSVTLFSFAVE